MGYAIYKVVLKGKAEDTVYKYAESDVDAIVQVLDERSDTKEASIYVEKVSNVIDLLDLAVCKPKIT